MGSFPLDPHAPTSHKAPAIKTFEKGYDSAPTKFVNALAFAEWQLKCNLVITGEQMTGKTTLAKRIADRYGDVVIVCMDKNKKLNYYRSPGTPTKTVWLCDTIIIDEIFELSTEDIVNIEDTILKMSSLRQKQPFIIFCCIKCTSSPDVLQHMGYDIIQL